MSIDNREINNDSNMNLADAIAFITEQRNDELYLLTDRINLHFGTEEEHIKQLRQVIKINNTLETLKNGLAMLEETSKYKTYKMEKLKQL